MARKEPLIGIYAIIHKDTKRWYVGQAQDILRRWSYHKTMLKKSEHHSQYLQRCWNKYGEDRFMFKVLEICELEQLDEREIHWCHRVSKPLSMNCHPAGKSSRGWKMSEASKQKMRESAEGG